ncbi:MFS transporter [Micromonospora sp. NIE79]|uniref:MFS transporter n=1 Tax=Micromonospora trifolii TaxID=2911208 RepID=A0ABS9NB84_9ACTN|nr:MFS transporter [Micromonospora trifolii]MCG5447219.1 MFS transporter [Micromonospora trifolii]
MTESWTDERSTAPPNPRRWLILAVILAGAFMILLATTIVNVAVAPIQRDLKSTYTAMEWVIAGYALGYGLLLIPAGRIGDRFGHRKLFLIGVAGFTLASAASALAATPGQLIAFQVVQGMMAGILNPPVLALIQTTFPAKETGKAYGIYGAIGGIATASGPLLGGLLIAWDLNGWDWRPVFLLNVPIGLATFVAALILVPESRGRRGGLDVIGMLLVSAAVLLLAVPLVEGQRLGWPAWTFVSMAAALPALAVFAVWELRRARRAQVPLVSMRLFAHRSFSAGVGISLCYFAGFIGLLFALSLHLQIGLEKSALTTGLILLPFSFGTLVGAAISDNVARALGRGVLMLGAGIVIVGMVGIIATIHWWGSGLELLPALLFAGFGSGLVIAPSVEIVLAGVPWQDAGAASGVLGTAQRLGQAIGVAVAGVVLFGTLGSYSGTAAEKASPELQASLVAAGLPPAEASAATTTFADCFIRQSRASDPTATPPGCADSAPGPVGEAFDSAATRALETNFNRAVQWTVGAVLIGVILTFLLVYLLPRRPEEPWAEASKPDWNVTTQPEPAK